ncbi:DUF3301 domain-containing protein [Marinimicrobium sp. ARAG 43.8]|uniref:DUF3301 domain-containing protein n=1 Tax=Marinimicrobium sp. ARAG 43.8 TaxID=3418719 RepID=UPI003CF7E704
MILDLKTLAWGVLLGLLFYYTWRAFQAKDVAYAAARSHCAQMQVQLLDQSVYLRKLWIRWHRGRPGLWRLFHFEFTVTGGDRYVGQVWMLGRQITRVELEPHRVH